MSAACLYKGDNSTQLLLIILQPKGWIKTYNYRRTQSKHNYTIQKALTHSLNISCSNEYSVECIPSCDLTLPIGAVLLFWRTCKTGAGWPVKWAAADDYILPMFRLSWCHARGRNFAAAGPRLWNSLPGPLSPFETLTTFKRQFKTFLFSD